LPKSLCKPNIVYNISIAYQLFSKYYGHSCIGQIQLVG